MKLLRPLQPKIDLFAVETKQAFKMFSKQLCLQVHTVALKNYESSIAVYKTSQYIIVSHNLDDHKFHT